MNFDIKTEELGDSSYVISLAGEVDLYTAPEFKQQLLEVIAQGARHVIVQLAALACIALLASGCGTGGVAAGGNTQNGKTLFTSRCASCHTLGAAGASGKVGPNLDEAFAAMRASGRDTHFEESTIKQVVADQ